jgi:hypothetical protein
MWSFALNTNLNLLLASSLPSNKKHSEYDSLALLIQHDKVYLVFKVGEPVVLVNLVLAIS